MMSGAQVMWTQACLDVALGRLRRSGTRVQDVAAAVGYSDPVS